MAEHSYPPGFHRWLVFGLIASVYFFVYFHRVAPSVIAPDLVREFDSDATALGTMASMYFYFYALEQPVVGFLADVLGPRRVVGMWSTGAAAGCVLFALASSLGWASVGRGLIGLGVGGVFVPAMKVFSQWFPQKEFSGLVGAFLAVGNLGALFATAPLAWAAERFGWRATFMGLGVVMLGLAICILTKVKESPVDEPKGEGRSKGLSTVRDSMVVVRSSGRFWIMFGIFFGVFGSYGSLQGLWATPFLMSAMEAERMQASLINMMLPLGLILGAPLLGAWADRLETGRRNLLLTLAWIHVALWIVLISGAVSGLWSASVVMFLFGVAAGGLATSFWGVVRANTPSQSLGVTTGLLNPAPFFGSGILQLVTGALLDLLGEIGGSYTEIQYRQAFLVCLLAAFIPTVAATLYRRKL